MYTRMNVERGYQRWRDLGREYRTLSSCPPFNQLLRL